MFLHVAHARQHSCIVTCRSWLRYFDSWSDHGRRPCWRCYWKKTQV